jgi:hypothetical protein
LRSGSNEQASPLRRDRLAGDHRKVDHGLRIQPGRVQCSPGRNQAGHQGRRGIAVRRQGDGSQHARAQGQGKAFPRHARAPERREEGGRHVGRRPVHRRHDRPVTAGLSSSTRN